MKQIQLDHNAGVVLRTGCTCVLQSPSSGLSNDKLCGLPDIPVEVLSMVNVRDSKWCAAISENKEQEIITISKIAFFKIINVMNVMSESES